MRACGARPPGGCSQRQLVRQGPCVRRRASDRPFAGSRRAGPGPRLGLTCCGAGEAVLEDGADVVGSEERAVGGDCGQDSFDVAPVVFGAAELAAHWPERVRRDRAGGFVLGESACAGEHSEHEVGPAWELGMVGEVLVLSDEPFAAGPLLVLGAQGLVGGELGARAGEDADRGGLWQYVTPMPALSPSREVSGLDLTCRSMAKVWIAQGSGARPVSSCEPC